MKYYIKALLCKCLSIFAGLLGLSEATLSIRAMGELTAELMCLGDYIRSTLFRRVFESARGVHKWREGSLEWSGPARCCVSF